MVVKMVFCVKAIISNRGLSCSKKQLSISDLQRTVRVTSALRGLGLMTLEASQRYLALLSVVSAVNV